MITLVTARKLAGSRVKALGPGLVLDPTPIHQGTLGWVFGYQSAKFLESRAISDALAGNGPLLVTSADGQVVQFGTALPVEDYLVAFERFGDPFAEPGMAVDLIGWRQGAKKISATKEIRRRSGAGMRDAKESVEACLRGESAVIKCMSPEDAKALVQTLASYGFEARQRPRD